MDYFEGVKNADSNDKLLRNLGGVVLVKVDVVLDELEKVLALDQLHDDVDVGLGLDTLLELEKERMRYDLHD